MCSFFHAYVWTAPSERHNIAKIVYIQYVHLSLFRKKPTSFSFFSLMRSNSHLWKDDNLTLSSFYEARWLAAKRSVRIQPTRSSAKGHFITPIIVYVQLNTCIYFLPAPFEVSRLFFFQIITLNSLSRASTVLIKFTEMYGDNLFVCDPLFAYYIHSILEFSFVHRCFLNLWA